jgi:hypothetical protein
VKIDGMKSEHHDNADYSGFKSPVPDCDSACGIQLAYCLGTLLVITCNQLSEGIG